MRRLLSLLLAITGATIPMFAASIVCVQKNYATPQGTSSAVTVSFDVAQNAGDLNVVVVGWNDSNVTIKSVTDSSGNAYTLAVGPTIQIGYATQAIYYAKNIAAASNGANVVTVSFNGGAAFPDIRILEYSGLDSTNPVDVVAAGYGNSTESVSGSATTTNPNDLLFGANIVQTLTNGPGANLTERQLTSPDGDIAEDEVVTTTGSYSVSAPLNDSGPWIMQMVAFRAASGTAPPPEHSVDLSWVPSITPDVVSYRISRATGTNTNYAQIAGGVTGASYTDTSVISGTTYTYVVQATDALGLLSLYSNSVTVTVP